MSTIKKSKNSRSLRNVTDNDTYYSSKYLRKVILKIVKKNKKKNMKVIDPCAGRKDLTPRGAFASDLNPQKKGVRKIDFLKAKVNDFNIKRKNQKLMFVMNPPFLIKRKDGTVMFLNKAAELCKNRNNSIIICVRYASKSDIYRIDNIDRHLHIIEEYRFASNSKSHIFTLPDKSRKKVAVIVQVWQWKNKERKLSPFASYKKSKSIPFSLEKNASLKYYIKVWNSPTQIGNVGRLVSKTKKKRGWTLRLKSLFNNKITKSSITTSGRGVGTSSFGLKIKKGYNKKVISFFRKMYNSHKWIEKVTPLSSTTISKKVIYYAYEHGGKLPTLQSFYNTKVIYCK